MLFKKTMADNEMISLKKMGRTSIPVQCNCFGKTTFSFMKKLRLDK